MGRAGVIREPVQVTDIEDERQLVAPQVREILVRQGMRSLLALPLVREDRLLGGLVMVRTERGSFSPEVVATLQAFATQSVLAIHNAGLFREIQRRKQYADAIVETSPVAIVTVDLDGRVVGWNPGAEQLFGHTEAESLGRPMEDLVATPEVLEDVRANIRRTLAGECDPRDRPARPEGRHPGGRRDLVGARGRRRRPDGDDRHLPRHHRPPPGPPGGRGRQRGEERLPGDHEPRDPHAAQRRDRDERAPPEHSPGRRAARVRGDRPPERRRAPDRHQRHPRLLQDRGGQARAGGPALRPQRVRRGRPRSRRGPGHREGPGPRLHGGRRDAGGDRRRRDAPPPGPPESALERGQVHRAGRDRPVGGHPPAGWIGPPRADLRGPRHRHRHPARPARPPLPVVQPGRRLDHAPLRGHRARARDQPAAHRAHGRPDQRHERGGGRQRVPLHDPGRRRRGRASPGPPRPERRPAIAPRQARPGGR